VILLGLKYALRERTRFALTAGGVACAVVLTVFLAGVYRGAMRGSLSYIERTGADIWVGRRGTWNLMRTSGLLPVGARDVLLKIRGVVGAEPILGALLPARVRGERRTLLAVGLARDASLALPRLLEGGAARPGRGEVIVDRAFARRAGLKIGDRLELAERTFRIAGISRETNLLVTQYAFLGRRDLESLLGVRDQATFFLVRARSGEVQSTLDRIRRRSSLVSAFDAPTFLENNRREIAAGFLPVLWAVALLGLFVGGVVVALMTYAAVLEKRHDYALLAALGGGAGARFLVVMQQSLVAALVGAGLGLVALAALTRLLPQLVPEVELLIDPRLALAAVSGAIVMAALGALIPARLATRVSAMEALRR